MTKGRRRLSRVAVVGVGLLVLAGCHWVGSGYIPSAAGSGRAAFSFDLNCPTSAAPNSGTLVYSDTAAKVSIRGTLSGPGGCLSNSEGAGFFCGTYVTQFRVPPGSGSFCVQVYPAAAVNPKPVFAIQLSGGPFDGYANSGPVSFGTIHSVGGPGA